jgi:dolichol-phosphate mannosyltransferase
MRLARRLLDEAVREIAKRGCREIISIVDTDNLASQAMFRSAGFSIRPKELASWRVPSVEMALAPVGERGSMPIDAVEDADYGTGESVTRLPVTVVIPCYNEEPAIRNLADNLKPLRLFPSEYDFRFVFVDDGSSDATGEALRREFASWTACRFVRHETNRGLTAAIETGVAHCDTEIVGCIDSDCSYNPRLLVSMLRLLEDGVDMVTASPYHPEGHVVGIPTWRLVLSRTASLFHRWVAGGKLYTYTSCFRVWRRSSLKARAPRTRGFLGITEMLDDLLLRGGRVVECPATLEVRAFGASKMKTLATVLGHLFLLGHIAIRRIRPGVTETAQLERGRDIT